MLTDENVATAREIIHVWGADPGRHGFVAMALDLLLTERDQQRARIAELETEVEAHENRFDAFWSALQRGTDRWRAANPGNELVLPDMANLTTWLLDRVETLERGARYDEVSGVELRDRA